jgi:hypothetical protein
MKNNQLESVAMIKVFGFPNSRSRRVVWALEEAGVDYEYVKVDLFKGEGWQPPCERDFMVGDHFTAADIRSHAGMGTLRFRSDTNGWRLTLSVGYPVPPWHGPGNGNKRHKEVYLLSLWFFYEYPARIC